MPLKKNKPFSPIFLIPQHIRNKNIPQQNILRDVSYIFLLSYLLFKNPFIHFTRPIDQLFFLEP
jgi:hypothetical protein